MAYRINHVHLKSPDPHKTAQWYVEKFGATIANVAPGLGGASTVYMDMGTGGSRLYVTSAPKGQTIPQGTSQPHYGLEHFGFETDDVAADLARLEGAGVKVLLPVTRIWNGGLIAYIEAPDNVRIELVQPPAKT